MSTWVICIIVLPLALAAALGTWFGVTAGVSLRKPKPVPGPTWSFSSWASNLSLLGGVLATVLAGASLSTSHPLDKSTFVALAAFFVFLIFAGPFIFQCARYHAADPTKSAGSNLTLLVACSLTLAAVVGQFATLALLYWEILGGGAWGVLACVVAAGFGILVVYYYVVTVPRLLKVEWSATLKKGTNLVKLPTPETWNLL
jgi:hypothetical protein